MYSSNYSRVDLIIELLGNKVFREALSRSFGYENNSNLANTNNPSKNSGKMAHGGFLVLGTRPPSAGSHHRPDSSLRPHHGYHTVSHQSSVDETLFGSHHSTKMNETFINFKAPWEYPKPIGPGHTYGELAKKLAAPKSKPRGRPLLWSPSPSTTVHQRSTPKAKQASDNDTDCLWNTREHFRHMKHTPTFVDETLFGGGLPEPTFEAPWNERKKGEKKVPRPYLWDPSGGYGVMGHNGVALDGHEQLKRPATALGISRGRKSRPSSARTAPPPVWKP